MVSISAFQAEDEGSIPLCDFVLNLKSLQIMLQQSIVC